MKNKKFKKQDIIQYYESCEIDYKLIWRLDRCHAVHLGYWDETIQRVSESLIRENEILAQIAHIKKNDRVLDAGCGVGGSAMFLAKNIGCHVTGITIAPGQVASARTNAANYGLSDLTEFHEMDFSKTSFNDRSFDVIWGIESICHADSKKKFINEAYRLLKSGGRLIIADGFASHDNYNAKDKRTLNNWLRGWSVNFLETSRNFKKYLKEAGFEDISYRDITENAMPSITRLYRYSFPAIIFGKIAEFIRIRNKVQTGNVWGAFYQYKAIKKGLWEYGMIYAKKS